MKRSNGLLGIDKNIRPAKQITHYGGTMKLSRIVFMTGLFFVAIVSVVSARSILERKMMYLSTDNKTGETTYWFVFMGQHDCTLSRKYPGEGTLQVSGAMNLSLMSSGYIEGNGYSSKGKLDCLPTMKLKNEKGEQAITIDSILCIYEYGQKVKMIDGSIGDFVIDVEGQQKSAKRFILTNYKMVEIDGEKELKPNGADIPLYGIAFSKEGLAEVKKLLAGVSAPPTK
jgi:hypothetical protein